MKATALLFIPLFVLLAACEKDATSSTAVSGPAPEVIVDRPEDRLEEGAQPIVVVTDLMDRLGFKVDEQISLDKFNELLVENTELKRGQSVRFLSYTHVLLGEKVCLLRSTRDVTITSIDDKINVIEKSEIQTVGTLCESLAQRKITQKKSLEMDAFSLKKQIERTELLDQTAFIKTHNLGKDLLAVGSDVNAAVLIFDPKNSMLGNLFFTKQIQLNGETFNESERVMILSHGD